MKDWETVVWDTVPGPWTYVEVRETLDGKTDLLRPWMLYKRRK